MKLDPLQEKEAVSKLKEGDTSAFNLLFFAYENRLFSYASSLLPEKKDAEEIVQEVFYRVWKNRAQLDEEKSFKSFLFTISKNLIYNMLAKKATQTAYHQYQICFLESSHRQLEDLQNYYELTSIVQQVANTMSHKRKQVFVMSRFQGMTNKEIADHLEISLSTVENHINKALKTVREQLTAHDIQYLVFLVFFLS